MWDIVKGWFETNKDFLIVGVAVISVLAGCLVEFSKKAWKPLEEKYEKDPEKSAKLKVTKGWVSQGIGAGLVLLFLLCMKNSTIGIVGGNAMLPLWFACDFYLQFLVSCFGLKAIQRAIENQKNKPKKEKKHYVKAYRDPETGELVEG